MGRKRKEKNIWLPYKWAYKHGSYYYVAGDTEKDKRGGKTWFRLGRTFNEAFAEYKRQLEKQGFNLTLITKVKDYRHKSKEEILSRASPKENGAIYFLIKGNEIVYVGQTTNVHNRLQSHSDKDYDKVYFEPVDASVLRTVEYKYIRMFRPKYNAMHNPNAATRRSWRLTKLKRAESQS